VHETAIGLNGSEPGAASVGSAFGRCLTAIKDPTERPLRYPTDTIRSRSVTE